MKEQKKQLSVQELLLDDFSNIHCHSNIVIVRIIDVKPKERDIVLINKQDDKYYYDEHPFQGEVIIHGHELKIGNEEVSSGDIVYLDGPVQQHNILLINKNMYVRYYIQSIIAIKKMNK